MITNYPEDSVQQFIFSKVIRVNNKSYACEFFKRTEETNSYFIVVKEGDNDETLEITMKNNGFYTWVFSYNKEPLNAYMESVFSGLLMMYIKSERN